jgi:hypothetical protein
VIRKGIIRDAKDPAQMYNFWMTSATEEVSLRPKTPFIGAEGQFEGHEKKWGQANKRSFAYLEYKPVTIDGVLAPPPSRSPMADVPVGMLQMALHAADNIKAVTGLFDSSLGARGSATSGVQEAQQQRQGDVANFHYIDNLHRSIRHCGRCLVDMIPHYYDAARVVEIMRENGEIESMPINQPATNEAGQPVDKDGQPVVNPLQQVQHVLNDVTIGRYGVTFDAGPGFATQREETKASIIELGGKWPKLLDVAGDVVVENMDWMGADKIARRLKASMPQELTAGDEGEDGKPSGPPPLPPEIEQHIQKADQFIEQLQQQLAGSAGRAPGRAGQGKAGSRQPRGSRPHQFAGQGRRRRDQGNDRPAAAAHAAAARPGRRRWPNRRFPPRCQPSSGPGANHGPTGVIPGSKFLG